MPRRGAISSRKPPTSHWPVDDGHIEIDNSAAERALRAVALGRKNYLFCGSDGGGETAAAIYTLLGTARLNASIPNAGCAKC